MNDLIKRNIAILGFHDAGWSDYMVHVEKEGFTVFSTTVHALEASESFYQREHGSEALAIKSKGKQKEPGSVKAALDVVLSMLENALQHRETREAFIQYLSDCDLIDLQSEQLNDISEEQLLELVNTSIDENYEPVQRGGISLKGYRLVQAIKTQDALATIFWKEDVEYITKLKEWVGYVNLDTPSIDIQSQLAASKTVVADTLQLNLERVGKGMPLIPIHLTVSSDVFMPNWNIATTKSSNVLTNAEIRMIYKLTKEVSDPLIRQVMRDSVQFVRTENGKFIKTESPWEANPDLWENRTRSQNKKPYFQRQPNEIPNWLRDMQKLSETIQKKLDAKSMSSTASMLSEMGGSSCAKPTIKSAHNAEHVTEKDSRHENTHDTTISATEDDHHENAGDTTHESDQEISYTPTNK